MTTFTFTFVFASAWREIFKRKAVSGSGCFVPARRTNRFPKECVWEPASPRSHGLGASASERDLFWFAAAECGGVISTCGEGLCVCVCVCAQETNDFKTVVCVQAWSWRREQKIQEWWSQWGWEWGRAPINTSCRHRLQLPSTRLPSASISSSTHFTRISPLSAEASLTLFHDEEGRKYRPGANRLMEMSTVEKERWRRG